MSNLSLLPPATLGRALLALLALALRLPAAAQAPAWQSAQAVGVATTAANTNHSEVTATAIDVRGNVFLAGHFTNTVVLGSTTLTSLGGDDVFVAKFNPGTNQFVWAQRAGGTGLDRANALVANGTSVYVAGFFDSTTAGFGSTVLANTGSYDAFVAKLTDAGSFTWAQRIGGSGEEFASALALNSTGVYITGSFTSPVMAFGSTTLTSAGLSDVFVAKLTDAGSTGSFVWAQRAGGMWRDGASALAVSGSSVYLTGRFDSPTAIFGSTTLTNAGSNDVFVAKLMDAGSTSSFTWAQRTGGTGAELATALAVSGNSVYVAGVFYGSTTDFGPTTLTNTSVGGYPDIFVAKLTDAGNTGSFAWAQRAGGTGFDAATALAVSGSSVYVAGNFGYQGNPVADFGPTTLTTAGSGDIFVAKLTDVGSTSRFVWAQRAGGTADDVSNALVLSGTSVYVAGAFGSTTANFGSIALPKPNSFATLGFLASLTDPTLTATTAAGPREPAALFPNPARHAATLRLPAGTAPAPLALTDALGRSVRRYPVPTGPEATLDLHGLPAGLYLLRGAGPAQRLAIE
ncbi:T9SS type A sorting domain-containing protein [Hymenobacter armeniacus]|uniref:T9SS type A sorting domain-containing protein n=1 Tax=Hymenobacter armeniacus TaxID=2771358 RepID=A0ABR8K167_9BACT|nr:T9SS type A sorting domain-containing protein [Hymenobacter armeniacus]MBD2724044.1 T9SS type A sorting domain-containing protein [Hymenobacter armeniacus]